MPKISVIMPIYNTDKQYLEEAIESILQQTYTDFELILIDDASTTDIQKVIQKNNDSRMKYIRLNENQGAAIARNLGIREASGEFIAFLDSDDIALPERFNTQINYFKSNPNVDCVGSSVLIIPEDKLWRNVTTHEDIVLYLLLRGCAFCQSSVMLRKKILIDNNIFYKGEFVPAEDYAFWLDLIGVCKFANIDEILVKYRWHGSNISITKKEIQESLSKMVKNKKLLNLVNFSSNENMYKSMSNFMEYPNKFSLAELSIIESLIPATINKLVEMGFSEEKVLYGFRKNYTKLIRKAPSKTIVRELCFSPLSNFLKLGTHRKLFYYLTKGFLGL
ncbi:MAG: glycosyltransferase family 2 protein [Acidaminococcaceae bacterium]